METKRIECPRCWCELAAGRYPDGTELLLCRRCFGVLIARREMARLLERLANRLVERISEDAPLDAVPDRGPVPCCPACTAPMEHFGYMGAHHVRIDHCAACDRTWLDPEELPAMARMRARTEKRRDAEERVLRQVQADWSDVTRANALANATGLLLLDGLLFL